MTNSYSTECCNHCLLTQFYRLYLRVLQNLLVIALALYFIIARFFGNWSCLPSPMAWGIVTFPRFYKSGSSNNGNIYFFLFPKTTNRLLAKQHLPMRILESIDNSLVSCISGPNWHNRLTNILKGNTVSEQKKEGNQIPHDITLHDLVIIYKLYF